MTRTRRLVRAGAVALLLATVAGCVGGAGREESVDEGVDRAPLGSPPDPGPAPASDGLDRAVREKAVASTVGIEGIACGRLSTGSGFVIADDVVATSAHVIRGVDEVRVRTADGRELSGRAAAYDPVADLALLRVADLGLDPLTLHEGSDQTVGALLGWEERPDPSPFRIDRPVTVRIEAVGSDERIERPSWLVAGRIDHGDSGGALIDADGAVVGIAYATSRRGEDVGYAVRVSELELLVAEGFDDNLIVPGCP